MGGLRHTEHAYTHAPIWHNVENELMQGSQSSMVRLLDAMLEEAQLVSASDIHCDPTGDAVLIRMRIDGILHTMHTIPASLQHELIARIKILSGLRIDEHARAQDGRFSVGALDVRVVVAATHHGERAVLRLLSHTRGIPSLQELGCTSRTIGLLEEASGRSSGLILITGPTGSGKTTTLYALLSQINTPEISIVTIEDPVEYALPNVNHMQVSARAGGTFADGLRSMLRQDPDVIMVGEIRDRETASIAIHAALTGHLVFSTLHTKDAPSALIRLLDMGIEPYLIASTVSLVVAQRLVRAVCGECAVPHTLESVEQDALHPDMRTEVMHPHARLVAPLGCERCMGVGYRGRLSVHEVMRLDESVRSHILMRASLDSLRACVIAGGMTPLLQDGARKAARSMTTLAEVLRVYTE